jgi:iron complex transport system substrate-binding protein
MTSKGSNTGHRNRSLIIVLAICILLIIISGGRFVHAREITDMVGRTVTIGQTKKVWPAYPPIMYLVYAIDPSLLVGWTTSISPENKKYIRGPQRDLPVIGGWFGQRMPNMENLVAIKPDLALVWDQSLSVAPNMLEILGKLNIPVVAVRIFRLSEYPEAFRFVGDVLNRSKRAGELAAYIERTIKDMKTFSNGIPNEKKVSVYYAIGADGLTNDCNHIPFLDEVINLAGGRNVHQCQPTDKTVGEKIDQERLLLYDPDVIITQDNLFFSSVYADQRYKLLRAVKNRKVYMIPKTPFNWLNYPPSFMRAIGVRWLAHTLYPVLYRANIQQETKRFFKLFLGVDISTDEANKILLLKKKLSTQKLNVGSGK